MELTLLGAALTGVAFAWAALRLPAIHRALPDGLERPLDLLLVAAAAGMLSGRLAAMIRTGVSPLTNPLDIIVVRGGVDTGFAALGAIAALLALTRHRLPQAADALAPAALAGLAGWQAGCLWRGACLGSPTDLPWGWAAEGSAIDRHPVELYAAALLVVAVLAVTRTPPRPWRWSGLSLAAAGAVRLVTEPLRPSLTGGPAGWYVAAVAVGLAVALVGPVILRARTAPGQDGPAESPP